MTPTWKFLPMLRAAARAAENLMMGLLLGRRKNVCITPAHRFSTRVAKDGLAASAEYWSLMNS